MGESKLKVGDRVKTKPDITLWGYIPVAGIVTEIRQVTLEYVEQPYRDSEIRNNIIFQDALGEEFCMDEEFLQLQKDLVQKLQAKDQPLLTKFKVGDRVSTNRKMRTNVIGTVKSVIGDGFVVLVKLDTSKSNQLIPFRSKSLTLIDRPINKPIKGQESQPINQQSKFAVFDRVQILVGINKDERGAITTIEPNPEDTADDPKIWVNLDKDRQSLKSPFTVLEFWPNELKLIGQEEHTPTLSQPPNLIANITKPDYYQVTINGQQIECLDVIDALDLMWSVFFLAY